MGETMTAGWSGLRRGLLCLAVASGFASAADAAPICGSKYEAANEMLDAAYRPYGTLYSGGNHFHVRDNVGATLDLYRLWRGLPDLRFRTADDYSPGWENDELRPDEPYAPGWPVPAFRKWIPTALTAADQELSPHDRYVAATLADLSTVARYSPDWWLAEPPRPDLSKGEAELLELAHFEPLVDWLQVTAAVSRAPWSIAWHLAKSTHLDYPGFERLKAHALVRYRTGEGIEWAVAALTAAGPHDIGTFRALRPALQSWGGRTLKCTASPAEYAAQAVARLEAARTGAWPLSVQDAPYMSEAMWEIAVRNRILGDAWELATYGWTLIPVVWRQNDYAAATERLPENFRSWANVARSYAAATIDEFIEANRDAPLDPRTVRALNVLSADDLVRFATAPGRSAAEQSRILTVAFLRRFALGQDRAAAAMIPELARADPERFEAAARAIPQNWPVAVRLALTVLALPDRSLWLTDDGDGSYRFDEAILLRHLSKRGIDLPREFLSARFLQRDLEAWLTMPRRWNAYRSMYGFTVSALGRAHDRSSRDGESDEFRPLDRSDPAILPDRPHPTVLGLGKLVAWQEITRLGPGEGLSRRLAVVVTRWVDRGSGGRLERLFAPVDMMAGALREIVLLGRHNDLGEIDGQPAGRRAFELLKARFPDSEAARATEYWYRCDADCVD